MKYLAEYFRWLCTGVLNYSIPLNEDQRTNLKQRADDIRKVKDMTSREIRQLLNEPEFSSLFQILLKINENILNSIPSTFDEKMLTESRPRTQ
tara:strand:+ start:209 stop:487 length:279 start_codon:yes stop_codon:yes gene_type:complete